MATAQQTQFVNEEDYLAGEQVSEIKHEYIDGRVYAMAGASHNHNLIAGNVHTAFNVHLKGKPCRPYISDMKVQIGTKYFYPDVMIDCNELAGNSVYTNAPMILVEVLSNSTRRTDKCTKLMAYSQIQSLQVYMLIEQDFVEVEVMRKTKGWLSERYYLGDEISF
ncbi:MAG TPA: Uma2 family endonuclease, partial [Agitococcus sp.]|nr:Uma2 family endonuclease [Agitococcus sp.]